MRIAQLELLRFGGFADKVITFESKGLDFHLIYGKNEAGKTTSRAALSELLFGIDKSTPYAFAHDYASLRVGAVVEQGAESLRFFRRKGVKNTLLDPNDKPLSDGALKPYLGQADRRFFERMFSLDHVSLVAGAKELLDSKDDVGRMLFQASSGLTRLGDLRIALEGEADLLWAARRSRERAYYVAFDQYQSAGQALESGTVRVRDYLQAEEQVKTCKAQAAKIAREHEEVSTTYLRLERIRRIAPGLQRRAAWLRELADLANAPYLPEDAANKLLEAQTQIAASRDELTRLEAQRVTLERTIHTPGPSDALLPLAEPIRRLWASCQELRRIPDDLNKRRVEVALLVTQAYDLAKSLGWPKLDEEALRAKLPSALELTAFEQLLVERERLTVTSANATAALTKRQEELSELLAELDAKQELGAPISLRVAVEQCLRLGDVETRRGELAGPADLAREHLRAAFGQLLPWKGNLAALRALSLPSETELDAIAQRFERHAQDQTQLLSERRQAMGKLKTLRLQESQVVRDAAPVTRDELSRARVERDARWRPLRQSLSRDPAAPLPEVPAIEAFEAAITHSDRLADGRFEAAAASATLQQIRAEIEVLELSLRQCEEREQELSRLLEDHNAALARLVPDAGITFESPARLRRWLLQLRDALALGHSAEQSRQLVQQYGSDVAILEEQLKLALVECQVLDAEQQNATFSTLLRHGQRAIASLDEGRARQKALRERQAILEKALVDLRGQAESSSLALSEWTRSYESRLERMGLERTLPPPAAKHALSLVLEIHEKLAKIGSIRKERIDTMTRDLEQFALEVQGVLNRACDGESELSNLDPFEQTRLLESRLTEQERATQSRLHAEQALEQVGQAMNLAETRLSQAEASLSPLFELANVSSLAELGTKVEMSARKREKLRELERQEGHLLESGDGLSLEALEAEVRTVDLALLEAQTKEAKTKLTSLTDTRKAADLNLAAAEEAFSAIAGHADAAAQAAKRTESLSAMTGAIERYVFLRTVSQLLKWSIERFRKDKQGPLLARGGALFSRLTLGAFEGLAVEYDDQDKPQLVGRRAQVQVAGSQVAGGQVAGGQVLAVSAMSRGTTDQLYLALRLAALELHLEQATALPFVADDLFVHFDDDRSLAAFQILGELAGRTQVLFFTHHEHLIGLAQRALGGLGHTHYLA